MNTVPPYALFVKETETVLFIIYFYFILFIYSGFEMKLRIS